MNYLINDFVIYDSLKGKLYTRSNKDGAIKLSKTLNRLMLFFVLNNNEILDKEKLFFHVWQEHNQVASENNLNSNVSILRRYLSSFFDEDMIITIPKIGFKFSAQVVEKEVKCVKNDDPTPSGVIPKFLMNKKESLILTFAIVIIGFIVFFIKNKYIDNRVNYLMIGQIDECAIYYIHDNYKLDVKYLSMSYLQKKVIDLGIKCDLPAKIYYYTPSIVIGGDNKRTSFLSYCPPLSEDKIVMSCETFYEN